MQTIAYLRKSRPLPGSAHVSWAVQEVAIRELAARHGDEPEMLSDWNRSGKATANRPGYLRLRTMVEERAVSVVYAYSLSRLSRSLLELLDLLRLCEASGVTIRTARDGDVDYSTPIGRLYVTIVAAVAAFERELDSERARDRVAAQRARGDRLGRLPYGARAGDDVAAVVGAYEEAGTLLGAARILNAAGLKSHLGRSWGQRSIRHVLERAGAYPHGPGRRGRPMRSDALLAGLLPLLSGPDARRPSAAPARARGRRTAGRAGRGGAGAGARDDARRRRTPPLGVGRATAPGGGRVCGGTVREGGSRRAAGRHR